MNNTLRISVLLILGLITVSAATEPAQPNIIIYMIDDLGWNHIGVDAPTLGTHDEQYVTPYLAKLANEGLSFTHAYRRGHR